MITHKGVWFRCCGKEKQRATVMRMGDSDGVKYSPAVVFKSMPSKNPEVQAINYAQRNGFGVRVWGEIIALSEETGLTIHGNPTAWWNESIHLRYHFKDRPDKRRSGSPHRRRLLRTLNGGC